MNFPIHVYPWPDQVEKLATDILDEKNKQIRFDYNPT